MLETDIGKSGEVVVEGHAIGRLDGFMFTPDASSAGSEAKALAGAAQKALAGEINARATRLSQAADGQFVLATDGTVRWLGQPVAKLVAGEEALKPRLRIIADEHLTGAPRDGVQARLDLWLKSHIERLLEPLYRLAAAEDVTGIARGVAFQLNEALGVLDRQKVADEVKGLDQPSRATLRKYGVRFGAYHIYFPALLKPAPRVLATQLWALKQGGPETKGLEAVEQLAGSGRTSIAADKDVAKVLYRTAGYRVCGERAVRVDILERLADLIRPALAWRAAAPGNKPPGAIDGFGFTVTVGMTSLAGCSGEDFASVLRSLGYRMEKRPKPVEKPVEKPVDTAIEKSADNPEEKQPAMAESAPAELAPSAETAPSEATPDEAAPAEAVPAEAAAPVAELAVDVDVVPETTSELPPAPSAIEAEPALEAAAPAEAASSPTETAEPVISISEAPALAVSEPAQVDAAAAAVPEEATDAAANPAPVPEELIEVWRPGRRDEHPRKPRQERNQERASQRPPRQRRPDRPAGDAPPVAVTGDAAAFVADGVAVPAVPAAAAEPSAVPDERPQHRRHERHSDRSERSDRPRSPRPDQQQRADRQDRGERGGRPARRSSRPGRAGRPSGARSGFAREIHQGARRGQGPPRPRGRSEFAVREARRAQGTARGERQGAALDFLSGRIFCGKTGSPLFPENALEGG